MSCKGVPEPASPGARDHAAVSQRSGAIPTRLTAAAALFLPGRVIFKGDLREDGEGCDRGRKKIERVLETGLNRNYNKHERTTYRLPLGASSRGGALTARQRSRRPRPAAKTIWTRACPRCPAQPRPAAKTIVGRARPLAVRRDGAPHRAQSRGERAHTVRRTGVPQQRGYGGERGTRN